MYKRVNSHSIHQVRLALLVFFTTLLCATWCTQASAEETTAEGLYAQDPAVFVETIAGRTRYSTQLGILRSEKRSFRRGGLVVATGANHADPISASALAGELGYTFLYVDPRGTDISNYKQLFLAHDDSQWGEQHPDATAITHVVIVGGASAVSPSVETQLKEAFPLARFDRVWGTNRYETSRKVLSYGRSHGNGWGDTAVVASGIRWPDGTSSAGLAAYLRAPIFLADAKGEVSANDRIELATFRNIIIVGGPLAVSSETERMLKQSSHVMRLWGKDRYGTNLEVALYELSLKNGPGASHQAFSTSAGLYVVKGTTYADYIPLSVSIAGSATDQETQGIVVMADAGHDSEVLEAFGATQRAKRGEDPLPLTHIYNVGRRPLSSSNYGAQYNFFVSFAHQLAGNRELQGVDSYFDE